MFVVKVWLGQKKLEEAHMCTNLSTTSKRREMLLFIRWERKFFQGT